LYVIFFSILGCISAQSVLGLHKHCYGIICSTTELDLVSINAEGKIALKAAVIPRISTKFFKDIVFVTAYDHVGQKYYAISHPNPTDTHTVYPMTLYVIDVAAGKVTHSVNLTVSNIDVSTIEYDTKQNKLFGVFFENLYQINITTGDLKKIVQIHVPKDIYLNGNVSAYDSDDARYILTVYELGKGDDPDVFYYYTINTITGAITRSPVNDLEFHEVVAMWVDPSLKNYLIEITDSILGSAIYLAQLITNDSKRIYPLGAFGLLSYGEDGRFTSSTIDRNKHNLYFAFQEDKGSTQTHNLWVFNTDGKGVQVSDNELDSFCSNYHFVS